MAGFLDSPCWGKSLLFQGRAIGESFRLTAEMVASIYQIPPSLLSECGHTTIFTMNKDNLVE